MTENMPDQSASTAEAHATRHQISELSTLPPLPRRSQELLQLLFDPDLNMLSLAELVEQTPALAARMLSVANSAFFSPRNPVESVPDAIIRVLGLNLVRDLSVSFVLNQPFELEACTRFRSVRFWVGSMETAVMAQLFATRLPLRNPPMGSTAYLGGLLHKLGLLALVHIAPEAMDSAFAEQAREPEESLLSIERQILGLDHAMAGAELASAWKIPPSLASVMGPMTIAGDDHELATLMSLLVLCGRIRKLLRKDGDITQDTEIEGVLEALGVGVASLPSLLAQWREDTAEIERLAGAFARTSQ